jgi:hypothetical protein
VTKHQRSQEFPRSKHRVTIRADWAPAKLKADALAKCKKEKTSLRSVILRLLTEWVKSPRTKANAAK